ncbi:TonB-dependent receptor [uncultured Ferrimonas sp.]|uniref:TonB-dependent receptor n=1 Tax=uncultured Ferrimonas sp. TaxID=432640 RepID=UPI00262A31D6|nr:TonB-dependent receptor [uncultured Ferrimonas sp.]
MSPFKPSALTLAIVAAGMSSVAYAAEPADSNVANQVADNVEVIEVRGIRRSLAESQAVKMESTSIVEAISAEDIGKLPDTSIAESLARLPGLAAQRLNGRANVVSVRGLSPDFTTATLNGREQVTISDNRGVEFDQYPSELMNGAVVYKTPDAGVMAQAIGGTIDLQTVRPLAHGERTVVVNARGEYNDLGKLNADSDDSGYRASISYIDQFADDTIGIALGYAKLSSPSQEERYQSWGYPENSDGVLEIGGLKPYVRSGELNRDGVMGVIEFAPNDRFTSVVDLFYSKFDDNNTLRGIEIPAAWGDGITPGTVENGLVIDGTIDNAYGIVRNDKSNREADTFSFGWNSKYLLNDNWSVEADVSYSTADRHDYGLETYSGTGQSKSGQGDTIGFTLNGDEGISLSPTLDYSDTNLITLGNPQGWGFGNGLTQDGFINESDVEDELSAIRLGAEHLFDDGHFSSLEFGVNYAKREKTMDKTGYYLSLKAGESVAIPTSALVGTADLGFIGMGQMVSFDPNAVLDLFDKYDEVDIDPTNATKDWQVEEKVLIAYFKANIDTELAERAFKGNIGFQVVSTDQSSTGAEVDNDRNVVAVTQGAEYTEFLPSANLGWEMMDDQWIRFATARTLVRPRMDQMNASLTVNFDNNKAPNPVGDDYGQSPWSADLGNGELKPYIAWQYDLSYETYFDDKGYFSAAIFYKDISDYIYKESFQGDFSDYNGGQNTAWTTGTYNQWRNGEGGYVQGLEVSTHLTGAWIDDSLESFGVILSGAFNDSSIKETADSDEITLPGLSETIFNATAYYEDHGFQARISARYRDEFLGEVSDLGFKRVLDTVKAETVVDAQLGYDFSESGIASLEGLSLLFQISNLTDEPFTTYRNGDERQTRDHQTYGRTYMLGASYAF